MSPALPAAERHACVSRPPKWRAALAAGLWFALAWLPTPPALAADSLQLTQTAQEIDAWPAVTLLADPGATLVVDQVLQTATALVRPQTPHANLGPRKGAVWLNVPLSVPERADGQWLLVIDYAPLDRIDIHVITDALPVKHIVLGDHLAFNERAKRLRPHVAVLALEPGIDHDLLVRVQSTGALIVPLRLVKADHFHTQEARFQLLQGLAAGIGLCLVAYALGQWILLRDIMFLYYGLTVACWTLFFLALYGLAPQHLWPQQRWLTDHGPPLLALLTAVPSMLLIERLLDVRAHYPRLAQLMAGVAVLALAGVALFAFGLLDNPDAQWAGAVLGASPIFLALRVAWLHVRAGDRGAPYILVGWAVHAVGIITLALLLWGWIGATFWTLHVPQVATIFGLLSFLGVVGVRAEEVRRSARRAERERESLRSLAHTDQLTGLLNRRGLAIELRERLARTNEAQPLALYLLDLDGFKAVNDSFGHATGDALLVAVAQRLRAALRGNDCVARLGGDEFVVVAGLTDEATALLLGHKLVAAFATPFELGERRCEVGLTVGFTMAPADGVMAEGLMHLADEAMYAGKQAGKGMLRRATRLPPASA